VAQSMFDAAAHCEIAPRSRSLFSFFSGERGRILPDSATACRRRAGPNSRTGSALALKIDDQAAISTSWRRRRRAQRPWHNRPTIWRSSPVDSSSRDRVGRGAAGHRLPLQKNPGWPIIAFIAVGHAVAPPPIASIIRHADLPARFVPKWAPTLKVCPADIDPHNPPSLQELRRRRHIGLNISHPRA